MTAAIPSADHRVHGMGTALEAPVWPAITADEATAILAHYPAAGQLVALRWHSPRPFSAASLIATSAGEFVLKRHHHRVRPPAVLAQEHAFIAHLRRAGMPVPDVVPPGVVAQGEWTYELHRRASGFDLYRDRPSWTPFLKPGHARQAGVALAQLHRATRGFAAAGRGPHPLIEGYTILRSPDPLAAAQAAIAARPAVAAFLADRPWRQDLARVFAMFGESLAERLARQPALWTHNDWHPSNLLWTADGAVSTVIDFGLATQTCALHDLAVAIERSAFGWLEPDTGADLEAALAIVAGYRTVLPLGAEDLTTLARLLPLAHVEFALAEIDYFAGILGDSDQALLAWQGYLLGHADWFAGAVGQDFLRRFAR